MVIETYNLSKDYGAGKGCDRVNLAVAPGRIFGFLGPNGAGKSTLVKMLVGLIFPTAGDARLLGEPLGNHAVRAKIGFLPENFQYHPWLTAREALQLHASLYRIAAKEQTKRIDQLLELVGLADTGRQKVHRFSKGMQQRLGLAVALVAKPELVFLDEPTSALDPIGRREIREILLQLKADGTTVFLNSHLLSEVEMVCDHVAFIKKGRIIATGVLDEMLQSRVEVALKIDAWNSRLHLALEELGVLERRDENHFVIKLEHEKLLPQVARTVIAAGGELSEMIPRRLALEELFFQLMQEDGES